MSDESVRIVTFQEVKTCAGYLLFMRAWDMAHVPPARRILPGGGFSENPPRIPHGTERTLDAHPAGTSTHEEHAMQCVANGDDECVQHVRHLRPPAASCL